MALFGGQRDMSLFRSLNKELIHRYIDTEVLIYNLELNSARTNIYEESDSKVYNTPTLMYCVVALDNEQWNTEEYGADVTQTVQFAFLRDDLVEASTFIEIGALIEYKSRFFEIDSVTDNQAVVGKDPDSWFGGSSHGYNLSIICQGHMTRQSKLNIVQNRFGNSISSKNLILPSNL